MNRNRTETPICFNFPTTQNILTCMEDSGTEKTQNIQITYNTFLNDAYHFKDKPWFSMTHAGQSILDFCRNSGLFADVTHAHDHLFAFLGQAPRPNI